MSEIMIWIGFCMSCLAAASGSLEDLRTMHVKRKKCVIFMAACMILTCGLGNSWQCSLSGLFPVIFLAGINIATAGMIGNADFYFIAGAGIVLGLWGTLLMLLAAFAVGIVIGKIFLYRHREYTDCELPFIPCISFFYCMWTIPAVLSHFG